jgi:hypothetical protein
VSRAPGKTTLVMLLHPKCPCSRATLAELARLLGDAGDRIEAFVFVADLHDGDDPRTGGLWARAAAIPGVHVALDTDGLVARTLGAHTSGQVVAYAPDGRWVFSGGLTSSRAHEGPSEGQALLLAGALDGFSRQDTTPVFGCGLSNEPQDGR